MSIVIKNHKYAYFAYRSGKKVVHQYLGLISNPALAEKINELKREKSIPMGFRYLFWDAEPERIDLKKNARYVIERVLEMGSFAEFQWIQRLYPTRLIIETLEISRKITPRSRNFWTVWLKKYYAF